MLKIARKDFFWWPRVEGILAVMLTFIERVLAKTVTDYSGCLLFRHPFELGGFAFSLSMVWAQVFPFVALQLYDGDIETQDAIAIFLASSFTLWLVLNIAFFCTVSEQSE